MEEPKSVLNSTTELSYVVIYAQLCFVCQWIVEKLSPSVGFAVMNFTWHLFGRRQQLAVNRAKHRKRFTEATFAMTLTFDQKSLLLEQDSIPLAPLMVVRYPFDQIESIFFFFIYVQDWHSAESQEDPRSPGRGQNNLRILANWEQVWKIVFDPYST